jgi:16S rRNA (guanine527-N7)-methyltransferase
VNEGEFETTLLSRADLGGVRVSNEHVGSLFRYFELLRRWNKTVNLTALPLDKPTAQTFDRLFVEPLSVARVLGSPTDRWFDLGSGGGSPAIPLKIALTSVQLTMVEARTRKASFLREAVRELRLAATDVLNDRFETLRQHPSAAGSAGLITLRALRVDGPLVDVCAFLLRNEGCLVLLGCDREAPHGFVRTSHPWVYRRCST